MDRFRPTAAGDVEDLGDVEIRLARSRRTDVVSVVRLPDMQRLAIDVGEYDHRLDAHLAAGANHAHSDLAAISNQHSFEHNDASKSDRRIVTSERGFHDVLRKLGRKVGS